MYVYMYVYMICIYVLYMYRCIDVQMYIRIHILHIYIYHIYTYITYITYIYIWSPYMYIDIYVKGSALKTSPFATHSHSTKLLSIFLNGKIMEDSRHFQCQDYILIKHMARLQALNPAINWFVVFAVKIIYTYQKLRKMHAIYVSKIGYVTGQDASPSSLKQVPKFPLKDRHVKSDPKTMVTMVASGKLTVCNGEIHHFIAG